MQLDNRAQTLLKALVERYIADGQPVGSRALSKISGLDLSPATIRNIMADLEEMGYVSSPHTSAGRIPTPRGYRIFVDTLLTVQHLDEHSVESRMHLPSQQPQKIIANAAQMLSSLSQFAGVVMSPRRESVFQQIEFLRLSEKRILLVIVDPRGDVQNRLLLTDVDYSPSQLVQSANYINQNFAGLSFDQVRARLTGELRQLRDDMGRLMQAAVEAGSEAMAESEDMVISGERNLLRRVGPVVEHEFAAPDVRHVRAEDRPDAAARRVEQGHRRADLHRRRIEAGADGRDERGDRAV